MSLNTRLISCRHLDVNGDGRLSRAEMQALMQDLGVRGNASAATAELMDAVGVDGSADIPLEAFLEFQRKVIPVGTCLRASLSRCPAAIDAGMMIFFLGILERHPSMYVGVYTHV